MQLGNEVEVNFKVFETLTTQKERNQSNDQFCKEHQTLFVHIIMLQTVFQKQVLNFIGTW